MSVSLGFVAAPLEIRAEFYPLNTLVALLNGLLSFSYHNCPKEGVFTLTLYHCTSIITEGAYAIKVYVFVVTALTVLIATNYT